MSQNTSSRTRSFGTPYIDTEESREEPVPFHYVHGGFEGTDTRFSLYFPAREVYRGRFIQYVYPGHDERTNDPDAMLGEFHGGAGFVGLAAEFGAYAVESNDTGAALDAVGGKGSSIPGYRASAESARFSKYVAAQIYGEAPGYGYVYGGSGGGIASATCLTHSDVWDGAVPFMATTDFARQRTHSATAHNAHRLLSPQQLAHVVDVVEPGGLGDPFEGLSIDQREALAELWRSGFPRGGERTIALAMVLCCRTWSVGDLDEFVSLPEKV
jgi:hypothetical protein